MVPHERHDAPRSGSAARAGLRCLLRAPRGLALGLAAAAAIAGAGLFFGIAALASAGLLAASVAGLAAVALVALSREATLRRRVETHVALSSDWLWEMDADLRFTYLSGNFAATAGMPAARVIGRRREDIADAATRDSAAWRAHVADLGARRAFRDFAYDGERGDGTVHHFRISGVPMFDAAGRFAGYCGIGRDVSALERAEARVADAIEAMPEGFLLWDGEGRLVMRNRAFARIDPAAADLAVPGVAFADFMRARVARGGIKSGAGREDAFVAERIAWHRQDVAADPVVIELEGGRWLQLARSRMRDGSTVEILSDVTELRREGAERVRAESLLADAIEALSDGFTLWDAEDRLVLWNTAAQPDDSETSGPLTKGVRYADLLRSLIAAGRISDAVGREEAYLAERVASRRSKAPPIEQKLWDGRWLRIAHFPTRDGGVVAVRTDITEAKRREAELERTRNLLVDAIEALSDGFALWDADDRLVLWNSAAQLYDSTSHTPLRYGERFADLIRERVANGRVREAVGREEDYIAERVASRRVPGSPPVIMELAEGTWLRVAHHPTRDGGVVAVRTNITEAKRHEAELERARRRLDDAIESLSDGFLLWDENDRLVLRNSAIARVDPDGAALLEPGIAFEDFMRRRIAGGGMAAPAGDEEALLRKLVAGHRAASGKPIVQRTGDGRWLRITHHRTRDRCIVAICSDITAVKAHEDALMRAESRLTDAIEAMSDGFILYDADDRLVLWNSAIEREDINAPVALSHGLTYEQLMRARLAGGWVLDAIGREDAYLAERMAQRARADGRPAMRRLASGRWVRVSERKTREGGLVVIRTDVTELKDRELDLVRARDAAQAASIAKSQFLATMSHELRTPLNAIIGFADLMRSQVYGPLGAPRYASYAADIHASGQHLLALITDLLDMSRIEAGRFELRSEAVALGDVIAEATSMVRGSIEGRDIAVTATVEAELPVLAGDRRAIKQILVNLLSNAVKFSADGGRVAVDARRGTDGSVGVTIADNGAGIAPDRLARIFEPFQHADASTRRANQGAGLGLSICKRLADLQGLELAIASTLGGGTTATLRFPATRASSAA
jgi:PAS domain S-box-containing protein